MILLEPGNRILHETVSTAILKTQEVEVDEDNVERKKPKRESMSVMLCDFDDATYEVKVAKESSILSIKMTLPCYPDIRENGAEAALMREFGKYVVPAESKSDILLNIDMDNLTEEPQKLIDRLALLKNIVVGGVFENFFRPVMKKEAPKANFRFKLRPDAEIFFAPKADRVVVIFALDFTDKVDIAVVKVFLQEFHEARRQIQGAPPVNFDVNPPMELAPFGITEPSKGLGFVSFAILEEHVKNEELFKKAVAALQGFRNYLQYHLKCSKAHFHSRMRARVVSLLKVLNRAKVEPDAEDEKKKKTISGKTFVRK